MTDILLKQILAVLCFIAAGVWMDKSRIVLWLSCIMAIEYNISAFVDHLKIFKKNS